MSKSLLFIPDISGFTKFVQTTEIEHSQHVISELLEVLLDANTQELQLAEIEGDALFFYKEGEIPSQERLLAQMEAMFTAFYSHLKLLETNRICPCNACATASQLELKIVAHSSQLQFIAVQGNRKPFGPQVIEAHRLLKNSVGSDHYVLISEALANDIGIPVYYYSKLFRFKRGEDVYDEKKVPYIYSLIDQSQLSLSPFPKGKRVEMKKPPDVVEERSFDVSASKLIELITNYSFRHLWIKGVERFEYNENEVTRLGTEHVCVVNGKHLNFSTITKSGNPGQLVYGEMTNDPPLVDKLHQFYILSPLSDSSCHLRAEVYLQTASWAKRLMVKLFAARLFKKNLNDALNGLQRLVVEKYALET